MTKQKPPPVFCNVPVGATFSFGGEKVLTKYHIPAVETRPILGAGFFRHKLSRNWAKIGHGLDKWTVKIWYDFNRNGGMQDV